jgi:hypothetical protein
MRAEGELINQGKEIHYLFCNLTWFIVILSKQSFQDVADSDHK